jgi:3-dehydroquinate synthase II
MKSVLLNASPYNREHVTLALESGVDGIIAPDAEVEIVASMARSEVLPESRTRRIRLGSKAGEDEAVAALRSGETVLLARGWEIIPVENLLAHEQLSGKKGRLILEVGTTAEALLAAGILESGVDTVAVAPEGVEAIKDVVDRLKSDCGRIEFSEAVITGITPVALGHRVCVDTLSVLRGGQGMLVGNSAAFTFLVNAETERNEFVAPRPFRINAGAVHAYTLMPEDRTSYLEELAPGSEILVVDHEGRAGIAVAGRLKTERRPMLMIRAKSGDREGTVFVQNAETIRLVLPGGGTSSVVALQPGDKVLCRLDEAGRHFGMRIKEEILE